MGYQGGQAARNPQGTSYYNFPQQRGNQYQSPLLQSAVPNQSPPIQSTSRPSDDVRINPGTQQQLAHQFQPPPAPQVGLQNSQCTGPDFAQNYNSNAMPMLSDRLERYGPGPSHYNSNQRW